MKNRKAIQRIKKQADEIRKFRIYNDENPRLSKKELILKKLLQEVQNEQNESA